MNAKMNMKIHELNSRETFIDRNASKRNKKYQAFNGITRSVQLLRHDNVHMSDNVLSFLRNIFWSQLLELSFFTNDF